MSHRSSVRSTVLFGGIALLADLGIVTVTACAADDVSGADDRADGQMLPSGDGGGDASCDANVPGCGPLDCAKVDFCPIEYPTSRLVSLNAVWGSAADDVWAVGTNGTILHGDGSAFTVAKTESEGLTDIYMGVWGSSRSDVWVLGSKYPLHSTGFVAGSTVFDDRPGSSWSDFDSTSGRLWTGVSAGTNVFVAGEPSRRFGGANASFWSFADGAGGGTWTAMAACTGDAPCIPSVRGSWAADANAIWAVGFNGQAYFFDGTEPANAARWVAQNSNTRADLEAVWGSSAGDVWAVGAYGTIRHTAQGASTWSVVESPTTANLHAVWGTSANDVWAVGDSGTVVHFDGSAWTAGAIGLPTGDSPTNLYGVWGSGTDDVWVVGEGIILHRTATSRRLP
jgi:hypothetical protein